MWPVVKSRVMLQDTLNCFFLSPADSIDIECKELTGRYANDVIASCAFGLKVDSHIDKTNEFYLMGKSTAHFGFKRIMVFLGYSILPGLMKVRMLYFNLTLSWSYKNKSCLCKPFSGSCWLVVVSPNGTVTWGLTSDVWGIYQVGNAFDYDHLLDKTAFNTLVHSVLNHRIFFLSLYFILYFKLLISCHFKTSKITS